MINNLINISNSNTLSPIVFCVRRNRWLNKWMNGWMNGCSTRCILLHLSLLVLVIVVAVPATSSRFVLSFHLQQTRSVYFSTWQISFRYSKAYFVNSNLERNNCLLPVCRLHPSPPRRRPLRHVIVYHPFYDDYNVYAISIRCESMRQLQSI